MKFLGALLQPIWARHEKVVELERDIEIVKQYTADYWLHKKEMSELKEQLADARSKTFMLQRSIDYLKIKMKEAQNV